MATNTKTFSDISGGYRANGNSFNLLSGQVLSSTSAVKIHSVTITCGAGNAYGKYPYVQNEKNIYAFVNSSGDTVYYGDDGGYFFYPGSNVSFPSSSIVEYNSQSYYTIRNYGTNFVSTMNGSSTNLYATINDMSSQTNNIISNEIPARHARCGTIGGDSSRVVYGVCPGTEGYASKTLTFNPDTTQLAAGETFNLKVYCSGNGVLCIPSGSSVEVTYEEIEVDEPEIDTHALHGTITFEGLSSLPSSVTCQVYQTGTYHDESVTITGLTTEYSFSGYSSPEEEYVIFPEIDGFTLTTIPSVDGTQIEETIPFNELIEDFDPNADDPYSQNGYIVPTKVSVYGVVDCTDASSQSSINYEIVDGQLRIYGPFDDGFSEVSVIYTSLERNAVYTSANETTINVSGLSNNYNVSITTSVGSTETITSNGTYTIEGALTIDMAYDNGFSENGTISYEDNNVINIEFREYRYVNISLIDTSKAYGMVPPTNDVLITITYSNNTSQSLQTPYSTGVHPQYWGLSGLLTNTNAPGVTITSILIGGIEIIDNSEITIENTADYSIEGLSSGIFPDFKGLYGTITFINGTPPDTITCDYYATGTLQGTVVIDITDDVTNYSYGANIVQGDEWLQFPELPGWMLTTEPSNDSGVLEKNATYIYTGPWKAVIPYVYITGTGWVEYEDTRVYNSSTSTWEQYDWKVYSEVVTTSNEYGETAEAALYDIIENDDGTMVIM